jgi:hypothetical protein
MFEKYEGLCELVTFSDEYDSYLRKSDNAKCYNYEKWAAHVILLYTCGIVP